MQNSNSLTRNHSPKLILKWWEMCQPLCLVLVAWICEFWVIKSFKNAIQAFWKWSRSKNLAELYALHKWSLSPQRTHRGWQSAGSLQYPPLLIALQLPPADTLDGCVHTALILRGHLLASDTGSGSAEAACSAPWDSWIDRSAWAIQSACFSASPNQQIRCFCF